MPKLLWHSNAPWVPTGYGAQTGLFAPLLAEHYDLAVSSFYGLEGSPIKWEGIPVFPGLGGVFGNETLPQHAARFFGGDPRGGLVATLMDVWVLDPDMASQLNLACWVPVDHEPAPPRVVEFFVRSEAVPIAMSKFGARMLGRLDPLYCPHGVDTRVMRPLRKSVARGGAFPKDAFVVGMVAANKGRPSRKSFPQALLAYARFAKRHENAFLYLHTVLDQNYGEGENLSALLQDLDIPKDRIRVADQYTLLHNPYSPQDMARVFSALDVLMNPATGEGFGIPVLEAQACGVPAIVTDCTAMSEVCGAGWRVGHQPHWTFQNSWQGLPSIDGIESALEECYGLRSSARERLSQDARKHALGYDSRRVLDEFMLPALRAAAERFEKRRPVRIPSRLEQVAA